MLVIVAIFYYLAHESRYAFNRSFPYGFRVALLPAPEIPDGDLGLDPNASRLTANPEGEEGLGELEEATVIPGIGELTAPTMTAAMPTNNPNELYRDDLRSAKQADKGDAFRFYAFATPLHQGDRMYLAWQPDSGFERSYTPYRLRLRLISPPDGVKTEPIEIDLNARRSGQVELPVWIARNDEDRRRGYLFELSATPTMSNAAATVRAFLRADWGPTLAYPAFGIIPLLLGTLSISLIAMLVATPAALAVSLYLSEVAPRRVAEWIKPVIELLAGIPTVVLGYFGLMLVAPGLQRVFADAAAFESGRSMLTASLIMALLVMPVMISVAEDALRAAPEALRDGAAALGLTKRESLTKVLLPACRAGLIGAILLGFARATGETMVVWMLSGGTPTMPSFASLADAGSTLIKSTRGVPDTIAIEMGNVEFEGPHYGHLFLLGLALFAFTLTINLIGYRLGRRRAWQS